MALKGRGRGYSVVRGASEAVLTRAFFKEWPALLAGWTRVRGIDVAIPGCPLPKGKTLKVGFASDLHAGPTTSPRTLDQAFELLARFDPDVLLLGGDFVLFEARHADQLPRRIERVRAPLGRYAVMGNHDLWADDRRIRQVLESAGVELLVNRTVPLAGLPVSIAGLDDRWTGAPDYRAAETGRKPVHLLLMHSPDHVPHLPPELRFTLALCGHTHGGQISWPGGRPIIPVSEVSRAYSAGRFDLPGGPLWVSRGVGNVEVPVRAFAPPDVLCITLTAD